MMVQAAHFTNLDYFAFGGRLHPSESRGVLGERQMSSPVMVISKIGRECSMQRAFTEDDDMIQAFAANRPDQPFDVPLCYGDRGADSTCLIPIAFT
jgi:hypothetical protein